MCENDRSRQVYDEWDGARQKVLMPSTDQIKAMLQGSKAILEPITENRSDSESSEATGKTGHASTLINGKEKNLVAVINTADLSKGTSPFTVKNESPKSSVTNGQVARITTPAPEIQVEREPEPVMESVMEPFINPARDEAAQSIETENVSENVPEPVAAQEASIVPQGEAEAAELAVLAVESENSEVRGPRSTAFIFMRVCVCLLIFPWCEMPITTAGTSSNCRKSTDREQAAAARGCARPREMA